MNVCADLGGTATAVPPSPDMTLLEWPVASTGVGSAFVADVMTRRPLTLDPDLPVRAAALVLFYRRVGGAPVVTASGDLVGVFSEADALDAESPARTGLREVGPDDDPYRRAWTVGEVCSRPACTTRPDTDLRAVARELLERRIGRLIVVDGDRVVGIVTRRDILHALVRTDVELQPLVDRALASLAEPEVRAAVRWGEVGLSGTATRRSRIPWIVAAMARIEGIAAVHDDLAWRDDDIVPPPDATLG